MYCKNCFGKVKKNQAVRCDTCEQPLHKDCAIKDGGTFCDVCYTVKEETHVGKTIDFTIPDAIRRSYIETYRSCPYKFFKEVIEGYEQPPTIYTQLGIDLHDLFEEAVEHQTMTIDGMKELIQDRFNTYPESLFTKQAPRSRMWTRAIDSIDAFYAILPNIKNVVTTEQTLQFSIGEDLPKVQITMDLITEDENGLHLHDWKTGAVMVGQKLSTDLQAPLYINAVQEHFKETVKTFTFYYLQENKTRVFEHVVGEDYVCRVGKREYKINLTDAIREVQHLFSQIKKGNFNIPHDTKKMYFTCKMCHLREEGKCQGAEMQSWDNLNGKGW